MVKALALLSGGLDSVLSAKIVQDQGVEVEAVHFISVFSPDYSQPQENLDSSVPKRQAVQLGIKLHIWDISAELLEMVAHPRHGYGKNINPCVDCRILMFERAKAYMEKEGFSFLISGEVLGQRPLSQRRDALNIVEREAQMKGLLLRPLSAKLLKASFAEEKGWVDRSKLFAFSGRSRKPQLALAKSLGIKDYLTPAGGCLLTDEQFTRKLKDLFSAGEFDLNDIQLLKFGRHFRYSSESKIIIGRNEDENQALADLAKDSDILLKLRQFPGPLTLIRPGKTSCSPDLIAQAAQFTVRYSQAKTQQAVGLDYWSRGSTEIKSILAAVCREELISQMRI